MSCSYAEGLSAYENKGKLGEPETFDSKEELAKKIKLLSQWIQESKHVVLHTGAGISTSAGIPDFRGPNGVWTLEKKGIKPKINISFDDAIPTPTHMAITELVKQNKVHYIVSQNIDALHLRSGLSRKYLAELHGNMYVDQCNKCERQFVRKTATNSVGQKNLHISCPYKGYRPCRGTLHDTILDWEHNLPQKDINLGDYNSSIADLSICLGTTLQINPSGMLPTYTKKYNQGKLVICNLSSTKHDKKADLLIRGYVDDILTGVMKHLNLPIPEYNDNLDPSRTQDKPYEVEWTLLQSDVLRVKQKYEDKMRENKKRKLSMKNKKDNEEDLKNEISDSKRPRKLSKKNKKNEEIEELKNIEDIKDEIVHNKKRKSNEENDSEDDEKEIEEKVILEKKDDKKDILKNKTDTNNDDNENIKDEISDIKKHDDNENIKDEISDIKKQKSNENIKKEDEIEIEELKNKSDDDIEEKISDNKKRKISEKNIDQVDDDDDDDDDDDNVNIKNEIYDTKRRKPTKKNKQGEEEEKEEQKDEIILDKKVQKIEESQKENELIKEEIKHEKTSFDNKITDSMSVRKINCQLINTTSDSFESDKHGKVNKQEENSSKTEQEIFQQKVEENRENVKIEEDERKESLEKDDVKENGSNNSKMLNNDKSAIDNDNAPSINNMISKNENDKTNIIDNGFCKTINEGINNSMSKDDNLATDCTDRLELEET